MVRREAGGADRLEASQLSNVLLTTLTSHRLLQITSNCRWSLAHEGWTALVIIPRESTRLATGGNHL